MANVKQGSGGKQDSKQDGKQDSKQDSSPVSRIKVLKASPKGLTSPSKSVTHRNRHCAVPLGRDTRTAHELAKLLGVCYRTVLRAGAVQGISFSRPIASEARLLTTVEQRLIMDYIVDGVTAPNAPRKGRT